MSVGPSWQWPQWPTPHCMLRSIDRWMRVGGHAAVAQRRDGEAHHHLGAADQRDGCAGSNSAAAIELRHDTDAARQPRPAASTVTSTLEVALAAQRSSSSA